MPDLRHAIETQIRLAVGSATDDSPLDDPDGDAGLFGPASVCWRVHGDFTSMMIGGVAALLMQMLHPAALAGVWDHSNFRQDMGGRLRRTARFIAGVTYGPTEEAGRLIAHVRRVHDAVHGQTADGVPYSAHDPHLLTWVHVAEVWSFLAAWQRYRGPALSPAEQDRYFAETALVAERLGAAEVPRTRRDIEAYLRAIRPELRFDGRTREVVQALRATPASPGTASAVRLIFQAAQDLLPPWAQTMHGFPTSRGPGPALKLGVLGMGTVFRWALRNSAESRARRRVAAAAIRT